MDRLGEILGQLVLADNALRLNARIAPFAQHTDDDPAGVAALGRILDDLDHDLIAVLREAVPVPLVLHGSSGVPDGELTRAVNHGIVKINVGTILNVAFTGAVRERLTGDEKVVDPRKYLAPARQAIEPVVARIVRALEAT